MMKIVKQAFSPMKNETVRIISKIGDQVVFEASTLKGDGLNIVGHCYFLIEQQKEERKLKRNKKRKAK